MLTDDLASLRAAGRQKGNEIGRAAEMAFHKLLESEPEREREKSWCMSRPVQGDGWGGRGQSERKGFNKDEESPAGLRGFLDTQAGQRRILCSPTQHSGRLTALR